MQGREYQRYQGPSSKEKPKRKTQNEEGTQTAGLLPSQWLLEKGRGSLTIPVPFLFLLPPTPSTPPPIPPAKEPWVTNKLTL